MRFALLAMLLSAAPDPSATHLAAQTTPSPSAAAPLLRQLSGRWAGDGTLPYMLTSDAEIAVADEVMTNGPYRPFASSVLRRTGSGPC